MGFSASCSYSCWRFFVRLRLTKAQNSQLHLPLRLFMIFVGIAKKLHAKELCGLDCLGSAKFTKTKPTKKKGGKKGRASAIPSGSFVQIGLAAISGPRKKPVSIRLSLQHPSDMISMLLFYNT